MGRLNPMPSITVMTTLYRSEPYIRELYDRSVAAAKRITDDYEIVFVDDGSPDNSKGVVKELIAKDPRVRLVELSRNFGHHKAVMTGLAYTRGDFVFIIDSDLEEDPELVEEFYEIMRDDGDVDVVYGLVEKRKGGFLERAAGAMFYEIINFISEVPIPKNQLSARLLSRRFVATLLKNTESQPFFNGVIAWSGYKQVGVAAPKYHKGSTTYGWKIKFSQALNALVSFSNKPMTYIAGIGLTISSIALLIALFLAARMAIYGGSVDGWVVVLASVWILGGFILSSVGLVGFYVGRIFLQVKGRPNAVVKHVHN